MACLYCGKEIGPIRLLRDPEFCTARHRKEYKDRLRKVLLHEAEPNSVPTRMAGFAPSRSAWEGNPRRVLATFDFAAAHSIRIRQSWPLTVTDVMGSSFAPLIPAAGMAAEGRFVAAGWLSSHGGASSLPKLDVTAASCEIFSAPAAPAPATRLPVPCDTWMSVPAAPAARQVFPRLSGEAAPVISVQAAGLPEFWSDAVPGKPESWMAGGFAAPSARIEIPALPVFALAPALPIVVPALALSAATQDEPASPAIPAEAFECWMPTLAPAPAAREVHPRQALALSPRLPVLVPSFAMTAADSQELTPAVPPPSPWDAWMASPPAAPVMREVRNQLAGALPMRPPLWIPGDFRIAAAPAPPPELALQESPAPRPAAREVLPQVTLHPSASAARLPGLPQSAQQPLAVGTPSGRWSAIPETEPVLRHAKASDPVAAMAFPPQTAQFAPWLLEPLREALPISAVPQVSPILRGVSPQAPEAPPPPPSAGPLPGGEPVIFHPFQISPRLSGETKAAGFESQVPPPSEPEIRVPNGDAAVLRPLSSLRTTLPESNAESCAPVVAESKLLPLAYYCVRGAGVPQANLRCLPAAIAFRPPVFAVRPVFDRREEVPQPAKPQPAAEVVTIVAPGRRRREAAIQHAGRAIAASLLVTVGLWTGSHMARLSRRIVNHDASAEAAVIENPAPAASSAGRPQRAGGFTPVAWARTAIAHRAASEVNDSFQKGMEAWGASSKSFVQGWSRNPDGYVKPGPLALFRPSMAYSDYRLEFLGEIESKGMSWVVRAHDRQNFYAMKFRIVEPGMRPVLAMVHYPVVGGKPGRKTEVPLSVMVHNRTPYHVAVHVRGNRFTTSIEGQEVDSWTDDALASGGVGFFSEAGESARLYWMKVSRNDDWLGRVCAFLSGNSIEEPQQTARLERPAPAGDHPGGAPRRGRQENPEAAVLAETDAEILSAGPQRERAANHGRIPIWST